MLEFVTFFLAPLGYAMLTVAAVKAASGNVPRALVRATAAVVIVHVALVWTVHYGGAFSQATRNGYAGFVLFHGALAAIAASVFLADRMARRARTCDGSPHRSFKRLGAPYVMMSHSAHVRCRSPSMFIRTILSAAVPLALCAPVMASGAAGQAAQTTHEMHKLHGDAAAYIAALEDPKRDAYQKPHEVMEALAVKNGEIIADIGAGSGYFSVRLSHHVGAAGRVYAVDVSADMIGHLHRRVRDMKLLNVSPILAPPDDPLLPEPVDRFLIVDVWHHIENQPQYLQRMKDRLKPGGQVVMIDFQKRELPVGPPPAMKIAREDLIKQMEANGFRVAAEHTFLPYQYFLVFEIGGRPR